MPQINWVSGSDDGVTIPFFQLISVMCQYFLYFRLGSNFPILVGVIAYLSTKLPSFMSTGTTWELYLFVVPRTLERGDLSCYIK